MVEFSPHRLEQAINGDRDALAHLLEAVSPELRRRLQGKISNRWQALLSEDDILQQTFADAFVGIQRFQIGTRNEFLNWLTRIAMNNIRDACKHLQAVKSGGQYQQVVAGSDESYFRLVHDFADSISTPSRKVSRGELRAEIQQAIDRLPQAYRQVIIGYDIEGRSAADLAGELGCSQGAIFMRRSRALALLSTYLGAFFGSSSSE